MLKFKSFVVENDSQQVQFFEESFWNSLYGLDESVYEVKPEHMDSEGDSEAVKKRKAKSRQDIANRIDIRNQYRQRIDDTYGPSKDDDHPITGNNRIDSVVEHIRNHYSLPKEQQQEHINQALERFANVYNTSPDKLKEKLFTTNAKLATTQKGGVKDKNGREQTTTLGATGAPSGYHHQHGDKETWVGTCSHQTKACAGPQGERKGSCLAQQGTYRFNKNIVKQDIDSQLQHDSRTTDENHPHGPGHSPHLDYHLLATHFAIEDAKKAKKKNKAVALRTNVTDESKDALNTVIHHIKTGKIKTDDETQDTMKHHLNLYNYGKNHHGNIHDPENNVFTIASDTGPVVSNSNKFNRGNVNREKALQWVTTEGPDNPHPRNTYVVVGGKSKTSLNNKGEGRLFKRPAQDDPEDQKAWHEHTLNNIRAVRRYKLEPSESSPDDKDSFHHPDGWGYITLNHNGQKKKFHYQDYSVPINAHHHDARFSPDEKGNTKTPEGRNVGAAVVSSPTAGTSNHNTEFGEMFHDINDVIHSDPDQHGRTGILEINHPRKTTKVSDDNSKPLIFKKTR